MLCGGFPASPRMLHKSPECLRFRGRGCSLPPTVGTGVSVRMSRARKRPTGLKFNEAAFATGQPGRKAGWIAVGHDSLKRRREWEATDETIEDLVSCGRSHACCGAG